MEEKTSAIIVPVVALERKLQLYEIMSVDAANDLKNIAQDWFVEGWKIYFGGSQLFFDGAALKSAGFESSMGKDYLALKDVCVKFVPKIIDKSKPALEQMDFDDFVIEELRETTSVNKYSAVFKLEINEPIEFQKFYSGAKKTVERNVVLECIRRPIAYNHLRFNITEEEFKRLDLLAQMPSVLHATFELKKDS